MHREVLQACLPCLIALAISFAAWVVIARLGGGRRDWRRLLRVHRCEHGGVQSLAFVLTLPILIVIILFIIQISQLMIGTIVVHYAAFAAARAASVWIPAHYGETEWDEYEQYPPEERANAIADVAGLPYEEDETYTLAIPFDPGDHKLWRIRTAAVMGCAPIAPSRDLGISSSQVSQATRRAIEGTQALYPTVVPSASANARIDDRIYNKLAYSDLNTTVILEWRDGARSSRSGRTYNPRNSPAYPYRPWHPLEVGWQDPLTVYVVHRYALLPGPGRFLADRLVRPVVLPQRVLARIPPNWLTGYQSSGGVATILLPASATVVNEGLKSVHPYRHDLP
ncbi:MAG: hypothetical protein WD066_11270 [Planctomycetaceae bacterium]